MSQAAAPARFSRGRSVQARGALRDVTNESVVPSDAKKQRRRDDSKQAVQRQSKKKHRSLSMFVKSTLASIHLKGGHDEEEDEDADTDGPIAEELELIEDEDSLPTVDVGKKTKQEEDDTDVQLESSNKLRLTEMADALCLSSGSRRGEVENSPITSTLTKVTSPRGITNDVVDIDLLRADDPLWCSSLVRDIFKNHAATETRLLPGDGAPLMNQSDINEKTRFILLDWLVDVHSNFQMAPEVLYLTSNVIDRYLETSVVQRRELQLVGVSSLLIASKYCEIYPPDLNELVYITDNFYSIRDILRMETSILLGLKFDLTMPSRATFLERFLDAAMADLESRDFSRYLLELSLLDLTLASVAPRILAAATCLVAGEMLGSFGWTATCLVAGEML
eukprot:CAMPEP_0174890798 /NCGR_PEP_ID=MMETSP0167-20121228/5910_1 /TAXON_ID=38298 /ORGANISM="Rhodella maculata, Strain CCMP736" /LENGTH=392 /DNA_ID=CAMNT_0016128737 /DNA_START=82 /DNA_END=1257 /DNA_ORIENTATION=+